MEKVGAVAILMATYNGGRYLRQQLDSLLAQSSRDWVLYIHDDGSTDDSLDILREYCGKHDNIVILEYPSQHGAKDNFLSLLERVDASYYMFCDQDDVWNCRKIEIELNEIKSMEEVYGDIPLLVFSDLEVVDTGLSTLSRSMWKNGGVRPELLNGFDSGAVFEYVTGCTMLFNRTAKNHVFFSAGNALMHDSWVTCCILKAGGKVRGIREPLVLYRQHDGNLLGATDWSNRGLLFKVVRFYSIFTNNRRHWKMLKSLGYGSFLKYLKFKYYYRLIGHEGR